MKTVIKILVVLFFSASFNTIQAQVNITLNVDSHPTPQISEWVNRANLAVLTVNNADPDEVGIPYKIKVKMYKDGNLVLQTDNSVATQNFQLGTQTFLADEIIPYSAVVFNDNAFKFRVIETGLLPAGFYDFCVSIVGLGGNVISTPEAACQTMIITDYQMPELLMPISNEIIQSQLVPPIIFRWTPLVPEPQPLDGVKYILAVTEVQNGQTPSQAFHVNYPIIEQEVFGTQFNWPTDIEGPSATKQYVWSVKPVTLLGNRYQLESNGFVRIETFTINVVEPPTEPEPSTEPETTSEVITPGTLTVGNTMHAGENHEFEVIVTQIAPGTNPNSFTGKGTVTVGFLGVKVAVEFKNIIVDTDKNLASGKITGELYPSPAPVYPQDWAIGAVAGLPWTHTALKNILDWIQGVTGKTIDIGDALDNAAPPVKFPLGVNFASGDQLAITEMVFESDVSQINIVAAKTTPPSWQAPGEDPQLIGFIAKEVAFHPTQLKLPPKRMELLEDVSIENINNKIGFTFKKPVDPDIPGCYVEWDKNGFSQFGVDLDVSFTRDWLKPSPDDGTSKSKANFVATVLDWNNMVLTGNLEKSEITSSQEMTIEAGNISFDMSDTLNPPTLATAADFPDNYSGVKTKAFRGFHMESLTVELPKSFETHSGGKPTIVINDLIINDTGVTLKAVASNVLQFPNANVADLSASIDTIHVDIRNSSMYEAYIKGRIALPVSKTDSIQNPLKYKALFHNAPSTSTDPDYFQLTIEPTGPINANLLKGTMELDPTSNIIAYVDKNKRTFQSTLNGRFVWDDIKLGPIKNVKMSLGFQNIQMNYNSSLPTQKFNFSAGSWAFASPQKFLANFPVTIDNIGFSMLPSTGAQLVHGKLNFDVIFNLTKDIGGKTKLGVELAVDENPAGSGLGKFQPRYIRTSLDAIAVYAHLSAVSIDGSILFRNDDPVFGDGFKGNISATFKTPQVSITAMAEFGCTSYLYTSKYRYWRVEAAAKFTPGIPFLSGVAFYGFGGGASYNMESKIEYSSILGKDTYTFTPKKGNFGFSVLATIGTTPKVETFNADVGLNGQFSSTNGLINIGFTGDFYVGAPLLPQAKRDEAQIKGSVLADYNFPGKHFYLSVDVDINRDPIVAMNQRLVLDINGITKKWYFKFGEPTTTNDAKIFGVNLYEYLMFGNDIYAPVNGFTERFRNKYHAILNNYPGIPAGGVDNNSATGKGFAMGLGFEFDKDLDQSLPLGYTAYVGIHAGAEVDLSMMEYTGQNCANPSQRIGFAGWRARGSIGMYANASAYVKNSKGKTWDFANIKAGAWLDAKFPRPTFVAGAVEGRVQLFHNTSIIHLLGDWNTCTKYGVNYPCVSACTHHNDYYEFDQSFQKDFTWGDDCGSGDSNTTPTTGSAPDPSTPGNTTVITDAADSQKQNLIKYIHPTTGYNFPVTSPIAVKYGLQPNESFDVAEQQPNGSVITRTFKLVTTVVLQKQNETTLVYANVNFNTNTNSLSEYLYTLLPPLTATTSSAAMAAVNVGSTINANTTTSTAQSAASLNLSAVNSVATFGGIHATTNGPIRSTSASVIGAAHTIYPPPVVTPPSEYDSLPPETPPVVNTLEANKNYKIIVTAVLKEYKNNVWINALKANGSSVQQVIGKVFRTGPMVPVIAAATTITH